jgi:hypothetical protein
VVCKFQRQTAVALVCHDVSKTSGSVMHGHMTASDAI